MSNNSLIWNATDPCGFPDIKSLDTRMTEVPNYNLTQLFISCPQLCQTVYGDGNPDIMGIGVMVSFGVQLVTVFLTGPMLNLLVLRLNLTPSNPLHSLLDSISQTVTDTNIVLATSFIVAAAIRLLQKPPLSEIDFINQTTALQGCIVTSSLLASLSFGSTPRRKRVFYLICCLGSMLPELIIGHVVKERDRMFALAEVMGSPATCGYARELEEWNRLPPVLWLLVPTAMLGLVWAFVVYSRKVFRFAGRVCGREGWRESAFAGRVYGLSERRKFMRASGAVVGLLCTATGCGEWERIQNRRYWMQRQGLASQSNEWGFGQIVALLVWAFLIEQIFFQWNKYKKSSRNGSSTDESGGTPLYRTISGGSTSAQSQGSGQIWYSKPTAYTHVHSMV